MTYWQEDWNCEGVCYESCYADARLEEVLEPPRDGEVDVDHVVIVGSPFRASHISGVVKTHDATCCKSNGANILVTVNVPMF